MKIKSITVTHLATPKKYYDVVNANPYNNFLIDAGTGYICSHNCFFDEISFIKNQDVEKQKKKAYDMLNTAVGGMKTRFVHKGKNPTFLALASSKRSDKSFLEEHMKKKLKSEKDNVYISDGPVWEVKPAGTYSDKTFRVAVGNKFLSSLVIPDEDDEEPYIKKGYKIIYPPIDFKADFIDDIDRALCDFAGISSSSISKYINAAVVQSLITTRIKNPFTQEILKIGDGEDDEAQYYNFFDLSKVDPALKTKPLYIHMDMSYTGDKTGISGVYIAGKKPSNSELTQANDLFFSAAFSVSIEAPKGRHISFAKNRNFIYWLKEQGFNIKGITTDTYQSYDTGEQLRMKGYPYHVLSVDRVDSSKICIPYQYFKSTIYEKRLELFEDDLLFREITDLERNIETGKVDHPDGGCFTGDTEVALVDGRNANFLQLIDEYNQGRTNYVYSINLNTKKIEPKKIKKAWKTKENQPLIRITFDNQQSVECTLDHRFMLRNGSYVEAKDLQIGDSLRPLGKSQNIAVTCCKLLNKTADVYDIEVEDNHNFALAAGVFVHNSKDACDALAASIYNASTHAEEFAYDYGETSEQLLRLNEDHNLLDTQTLSAGLEEELKALGKSRMGLSQPPDLSSISSETYDYFDIPIL